MSREKLHENIEANSSVENLLPVEDSSPDFLELIDSESVDNLTPQHVPKEDQRVALLNDKEPSKGKLHHPKRSSFDLHNLVGYRSPGRFKFTRRANTISADNVSVSTCDTSCEKEGEVTEDETEPLTNRVPSESSLWRDQNDASTSYDVSSRQLDEDDAASATTATTIRADELGESDDQEFREAESTSTDHKRRPKTNYVRLPTDDRIIEVANKTSKQLYAVLAKELGLSCRMSDQCRCIDCQSAYLQCDDAEGESAPDGGLSAGTPMIVSEVFGHGTAPACCLL